MSERPHVDPWPVLIMGFSLGLALAQFVAPPASTWIMGASGLGYFVVCHVRRKQRETPWTESALRPADERLDEWIAEALMPDTPNDLRVATATAALVREAIGYLGKDMVDSMDDGELHACLSGGFMGIRAALEFVEAERWASGGEGGT